MAYDEGIVPLLVEATPGFICNFTLFEDVAGIESQGGDECEVLVRYQVYIGISPLGNVANFCTEASEGHPNDKRRRNAHEQSYLKRQNGTDGRVRGVKLRRFILSRIRRFSNIALSSIATIIDQSPHAAQGK